MLCGSLPEHLQCAHSTTPVLLESGPTPRSTLGQQPYWLAHMVRACTHTPFTAVHALQRTHEDPQGQAQHARHPQYPHTRHQVQTRTNMDRRRTRTRSVTRRSAQRTQTCGQAARHRVQPLHPARQLPLEVRPHCALSVHHAQKADEISKKRQDLP